MRTATANIDRDNSIASASDASSSGFHLSYIVCVRDARNRSSLSVTRYEQRRPFDRAALSHADVTRPLRVT
ncbi:hypothetical protein X777_07014 [Ooceraea biroi]|uniref:Uncharacterized protein n=1 Tax=Ooceraea biroi TaxID=2015173 RepID=A0A026WD04_OOCBI|nr:hypothetical protein X777_07014 [Ooceraea biroi]